MANSGKVSSNGYEGRYITFSWSLTSQNIKANTSTISWKLEGDGVGQASRYKAGAFKVVIDGTTVYSTSQDDRIWLYDGTVVASGNYTLQHNAAGAKSFNVSIQAGIYYYAVNCTGSANFSLPNISRVSDITAVNGANTSDILSVNYTEYVSSYTNNLIIKLGNTTIQTITNYKSGAGFNLSDGALSSIYSATQTTSTATLSFTLQTYDGSTLLGTSSAVTKVLNISDSNPTINAVSYADTNATTIAITGNNQYIIRNNSTLTVTVSGLKAYNGATLRTVRAVGGGKTKVVNLLSDSSSNVTLDMGVINQTGNFTVDVTLADSRGFKAVKTLNILVYDWTTPTAVIAAARVDNYYTSTNITVNATYSSLGNNNAITITAEYKKTSDASYSSPVTLTDGVESTLSLDNNFEWNLKVIVADKIGSTTYNLVIGRGLPIWFADRRLNSVGVNCFPKNANSLEVGGIDIIKELFYQSGDTYSVNSRIVDNGYISDSSKQINFTLTMPKSMANVTPEITELKVNGRHVGGGYIFSNSYIAAGYDVLNDSNLTVSILNQEDDFLTIMIQSATAWSVTNNSPVSISIESLEISFT